MDRLFWTKALRRLFKLCTFFVAMFDESGPFQRGRFAAASCVVAVGGHCASQYIHADKWGCLKRVESWRRESAQISIHPRQSVLALTEKPNSGRTFRCCSFGRGQVQPEQRRVLEHEGPPQQHRLHRVPRGRRPLRLPTRLPRGRHFLPGCAASLLCFAAVLASYDCHTLGWMLSASTVC